MKENAFDITGFLREVSKQEEDHKNLVVKKRNDNDLVVRKYQNDPDKYHRRMQLTRHDTRLYTGDRWDYSYSFYIREEKGFGGLECAELQLVRTYENPCTISAGVDVDFDALYSIDRDGKLFDDIIEEIKDKAINNYMGKMLDESINTIAVSLNTLSNPAEHKSNFRREFVGYSGIWNVEIVTETNDIDLVQPNIFRGVN